MQNTVKHPNEFNDLDEDECGQQFSKDVIGYQKRVENVISWVFSRQEELQKRPPVHDLQDAPFRQVLDEYSLTEKFISEFCEHCQTIMQCREVGQEMKENGENGLTEEDRDEIGFSMDAMTACYENFKILATDRLRSLQMILEERQQTKIERFEEWLKAIEMKITSSNNIGPDYNAIQRQLKYMDDLMIELEQKQDFLNFMSSIIIFDEVDTESLQIRARSCETLDQRLENMNRRWTEICRIVDDRNDKLRKAESIWKLLTLEGPQLTAWLKKIERGLFEVSEAARNLTDIQGDDVFMTKLLARSDKIDSEIKSKATFYTSLESRVRTEIEKFDDPCSMLVIELEKKLEEVQDSWNTIMNQKRMLDYKLQAVTNSLPAEPVICSMIPLPDPITPSSTNDIRFSNPLGVDDYSLNSDPLQTSEAFSVQSEFSTDQLKENSHSCRVEEWKHSLESFSTWLKRVEVSLSIDDGIGTINDHDSFARGWSHLDLQRKLLLLIEVENEIVSSCQDEFDCLILHGQQIIEDLIPEIGENEYEANLKEILTDIEIRYGAVNRCLNERKQELMSKDRWYQLLKSLKNSCDYLIEEMGHVLPEVNIGIDLITLAQQQDQLMHAKADLDDNSMVQSCIQEAKTFLKLCDILQQQQQQNQSDTSPPLNDVQESNNKLFSANSNDIWLSLRDLKEDIESQLDRLTLHYSELSQLIDDRLARLDEVHKEMHGLQHKMQELATGLQVAEILRSNWPTLENLTIEKLSEQLEDLKLYRERLCEIESTYKMMNSIFEWMTQFDVPLSQQNLNRISELKTIWDQIQASVEERQKLIEQAFDSQGASEQRFLNQTIEDLPRWERRVAATSRVPYFIDHETSKPKWDHPKFTDLLETMGEVKKYVYAAYRTAMKLRILQKKLGIDMLMLEHLKDILNSSSNPINQTNGESDQVSMGQTNDNSSKLIGVEQIILCLKLIYEQIQSDEKPTMDVPLSIDLTLNWLLNVYDA